MSRARKADSDLPVRMYRHGLGFRLHHPDGSRINLGRDRDEAIRRYALLMTPRREEFEPMTAAAVWKRHRRGAKQRQIEFALDIDEVQSLLDATGWRCAITELPFTNEKPTGLRIRPWAPSLDRIDGSKGYATGNVRPVCAFVNVAMNGFGEAMFRTVLRRLVDAEVAKELWRHGLQPFPTRFPREAVSCQETTIQEVK